MKSVAKWIVVVMLVAAIAGPALGTQEEQKKKKKSDRGQAQNAAVTNLLKQVGDAGLSEEQTAKVKELAKGANEKLTAIAKERTELIGADGQQKINEARKAAQADGKKGKDLQEAINAALNLTGEKAAQYKELQAKQQSVVTDLRKAVSEVLTPEQREKAGLNQRGKGNNKKAADK
jgi:hypothetical protein